MFNKLRRRLQISFLANTFQCGDNHQCASNDTGQQQIIQFIVSESQTPHPVPECESSLQLIFRIIQKWGYHNYCLRSRPINPNVVR